MTSDRYLASTSDGNLTLSSLVEKLQPIRINLDVQRRLLLFDKKGFGDSSFQPVRIVSSEDAKLRWWWRWKIFLLEVYDDCRLLIRSLVFLDSFTKAALGLTNVGCIFIIFVLVVINQITTMLFQHFILRREERWQLGAVIHDLWSNTFWHLSCDLLHDLLPLLSCVGNDYEWLHIAIFIVSEVSWW